MIRPFLVIASALLVSACGGQPPIFAAYPNYLYGPGTWVPNTYYGGYYGPGSSGYYSGGYSGPSSSVIWGATEAPLPVITAQKRTTGQVMYAGRLCSMDYFETSYSDGSVVYTTSVPQNCGLQAMPVPSQQVTVPAQQPAAPPQQAPTPLHRPSS